MKIPKKRFKKIKKAILTLFLTLNLALVATSSAVLDNATDSAKLGEEATSTDATQSSQIVASPYPSPIPSPIPSPTTTSTVISPSLDEYTYTVDPTGKFIEDHLTVKFKEEDAKESKGVQSALKSHNARFIREDLKLVGGYKIIKVDPQKRDELKKVLENNPNIESVEENPVVRTAGGGGGGGSPSCNLQANDWYLCNGYQWALQWIQAPQAWMIEKGDSGSAHQSDVTIAVIDTGVDYNHPDLKKAPTGGGKVYLGDDMVNAFDNDPMDEDGHGTIVAGIAGAFTNNGFGIAGAGYYVKLLAMRVQSGDFGNADLLAAGIKNAVLYYDNVKVINISLTTAGDSDYGPVRDAVAYAQSRGAVIVAATKNSSPGNYNCFQGFPSAYPGVVSVIATDRNDQHASGCGGSYYNGRQYQGVEVSAPGDEIFSLKKGSDFESSFGYLLGSATSWATPFVSGLAGLLASHPKGCNLSPAQIYAAIKYGSQDLGTPGWDMEFGEGRVDFWDSLAFYGCT